MSHEPGRERHMTRHCECCHDACHELYYFKPSDEYLCQVCIDGTVTREEDDDDTQAS